MISKASESFTRPKATLTFGISTTQSRYQGAKSIEESVRDFFDEIVIVVQGSDEDRVQRKENILIIHRKEAGLSNSRNLLLMHSTSTWLWINDDDIQLLPEHVATVRENILKYGCFTDVFAGRIGCIGCGGYFKKYRFRWFKPLLFIQLSSVEIIINRVWCEDNLIKFDPNFGLGSSMPLAEEPIFASDVLRAGGRIMDIDAIIVNHPCNEVTKTAWKSWGNENISHVRGKAAGRIGGQRGFFVLLFWIINSAVKGGSLKSVKRMVSGYCE